MQKEFNTLKFESETKVLDNQREIDELHNKLKIAQTQKDDLRKSLEEERKRAANLQSEYGKIDKEHAEYFSIITDQKNDINSLLETISQKGTVMDCEIFKI